jgi:hypothetical protein
MELIFAGIGYTIFYCLGNIAIIGIPVAIITALILTFERRQKNKRNNICSRRISFYEVLKQVWNQSNLQYKIHLIFTVVLPLFPLATLTVAALLIGYWPQANAVFPIPWLNDLQVIAVSVAGWSVILWIGCCIALSGYTTSERQLIVWSFIIFWTISLLGLMNLWH